MIEGVEYFEAEYIRDNRGYFSKKFGGSDTKILEFDLNEVFITASSKGVIRGMHLQTGSAANWRFINVLHGSFFDIVLDLRKDSATYLKHVVQILEQGGIESVLVPPGVAHGFQALEESELLYLTTTKYSPDQDVGVNINSLGIDFPISITTQSERDAKFPNLTDFI